MKTLLALITLVPSAALAQPTLSALAPAVRSGNSATVTVSLSGASGAALQFFLPQIPGVAYAATPGTALSAGKTLTCAPSPAPAPALYGCVVAGGVTPLADGAIATITFPAPALGVYALPMSLQLGATATGDPIAIAAGSPLSLIVTSPCDVNGDGKIDSADVALSIQAAISRLVSAALDLTGDGTVNVVDVQRIIAAANGGTCRVSA